ncbi:MAG: ribosome biogenesis factor YjgA [Francisellaceae bacterium]
MPSSVDNDDKNFDALSLSKTRVKKEYLEITELGRQLLNLSHDKIKKLPLDERIIQELIKAKSMQRIALKRQIQYIGKLMRNSDIEAAKGILNELENKHKQDNLKFHRLEILRDTLLNPAQSDTALSELIMAYPELDVQKLRQLIRNHHKEQQQNKPPRCFKELFQLLKDTIQS